jgi:hypothetical protein
VSSSSPKRIAHSTCRHCSVINETYSGCVDELHIDPRANDADAHVGRTTGCTRCRSLRVSNNANRKHICPKAFELRGKLTSVVKDVAIPGVVASVKSVKVDKAGDECVVCIGRADLVPVATGHSQDGGQAQRQYGHRESNAHCSPLYSARVQIKHKWVEIRASVCG